MIYINTRSILGRELTGVQRYGREIYSRLPQLTAIDAPKFLKNGIKGQLWDQLTIPVRLNGLLWSPANLGPLLYRNQVVTIHDVSPFDHPEWFDSKYLALNRSILPILVQTSQHIITVSEYSKSRIIYNFGVDKNKISVTYLAADQKFGQLSKSAIEEEIKLKNWPENYILCVGSLEPRKNLKILFEVWERWENKPQNLKLLVVGGAGKVFSGVGFEKIPTDIELLGRVEDADLPGLYACAKAFIYPSVYEGFGLPPLEAMASGTPVITSNTTSLPEVVGDAALTVNPLKHADILSALTKITLDKSLSENLIGLGLERSKKFSWDYTAKETWEILSEERKKI